MHDALASPELLGDVEQISSLLGSLGCSLQALAIFPGRTSDTNLNAFQDIMHWHLRRSKYALRWSLGGLLAHAPPRSAHEPMLPI